MSGDLTFSVASISVLRAHALCVPGSIESMLCSCAADLIREALCRRGGNPDLIQRAELFSVAGLGALEELREAEESPTIFEVPA